MPENKTRNSKLRDLIGDVEIQEGFLMLNKMREKKRSTVIDEKGRSVVMELARSIFISHFIQQNDFSDKVWLKNGTSESSEYRRILHSVEDKEQWLSYVRASQTLSEIVVGQAELSKSERISGGIIARAVKGDWDATNPERGAFTRRANVSSRVFRGGEII